MPASRTISPGGRPTAQRASEISDRILAAAGQAFARAGGRLSLDDVATEAEVSKQAIYRRYSGKSDLIKAVIEHALNAILVSKGEPVPSAPLDAVRHWAWRLFVNNSAANSGAISRHLQGMMMENDEIRHAVENWEKRLLEPIESALRTLGTTHDLGDIDPGDAGRTLYDLMVTGSRRVSDSCQNRLITDADRRARFEPRWRTFVAMLGV